MGFWYLNLGVSSRRLCFVVFFFSFWVGSVLLRFSFFFGLAVARVLLFLAFSSIFPLFVCFSSKKRKVFI
jgi:hypothetical protein